MTGRLNKIKKLPELKVTKFLFWIKAILTKLLIVINNTKLKTQLRKFIVMKRIVLQLEIKNYFERRVCGFAICEQQRISNINLFKTITTFFIDNNLSVIL